MISRTLGALVAVALVFLCVQGCNDLILPAGPLGSGEELQPSGTTMLEPTQVYPREGPVGTEINVFGGGDTFPSGFYRVVFTGGAAVEFFQPNAAGVLVIGVPTGARSGPFGFSVGGRPHNGHEIGAATPDGFAVYTVRDPGFRVTDEDPWIP